MSKMRRAVNLALPLLPALASFGYLCKRLWFTQDDAFISYRYVQNFLNGHGLVYNIGERIEGFTNFSWVVLEILVGGLGLDYWGFSRVFGMLCGAGTIVVTFFIARRMLGEKSSWLALIPVYLLGINYALVYWSISGLETGLFTLLVSLSLYWYITGNWLLIVGLAGAVWTRPEGALVTALLLIVETARTRQFPRFTFACAAAAFVASLPMLGFKLSYYGGIVPNPFYAKTGSSWEQYAGGLQYAGEFFLHYGFLGIGWLVPLIYWKRLPRFFTDLWLFGVLYTIYIIAVGGDVLKVNRFFLPLFGISGIFLTVGFEQVTRALQAKSRYALAFIVAIPLLVLTRQLPLKTVEHFNLFERAFIHKMNTMAKELKASDNTNFSVALPTIGMFGYELIGHDIIDMLGLTDSTIARHPEVPIAGMQTTWKERQHNTPYLLGRKPDYFVFSTSLKPSAPAERALMLYSQFIHNYRYFGWYYYHPEFSPAGVLIGVHKRVRPFEGPFQQDYPLEWVNMYKLSLEKYSRGEHADAVNGFNTTRAIPGCPRYPEMLGCQAMSLANINRVPEALALLDTAVAIDSFTIIAHKEAFLWKSAVGNQGDVAVHRDWMLRLTPWEVTRLDRLLEQARIQQEQRQRMQGTQPKR